MDSDKKLHIFWVSVWAVVLGLSILGLFWKPAMYILAGIAAIMVGIFVSDLIHYLKLK